MVEDNRLYEHGQEEVTEDWEDWEPEIARNLAEKQRRAVRDRIEMLYEKVVMRPLLNRGRRRKCRRFWRGRLGPKLETLPE